MRIQTILFPKEDICNETELYYRHPAKQFGPKFTLPPNQTISFDTYFNSFSIEKWKEYTIIENLSLSLNVTGKCRIDLYEATLIKGEVHTRLLSSKDKNSQENAITLTFPDIKNLCGICYFTITSNDEPCEIAEGFYSTEIDSKSINRIKIGIGICTYKREQFILKNLNAIQKAILDNPESELHDNLEIIVSDNGETLQNYNYSHPKVRIFPNINAGGSGGFARCMIEAIKAKENLNLTHLLLMDDDIVLDPAILLRTYKILQLLREDHLDKILGGIMLKLEKPFEQLEFGAKRSSNLNTDWCVRNNPDIDCSVFESVVRNELTNIITPDYNGWWFCCIPIQYIRPNNLPLPLFIHCDDMEYGCRSAREIILINGIAVWHSLQNKYSPALLYYDTRNRLLVSILRDPISVTSPSRLMKYILIQFISFTCRYMYLDWKIFTLAIKELCKGAENFKKINPIQQHSMLNGISKTDKTLCKNLTKRFLSDEDIESAYKKMEKFSFSQKILLTFSILNSFIPFGKNSPICVNNLCYQNFIGHNFIIWRHNKVTEEGLCLKKSPLKALNCLFDLLALWVLIALKWNKIRKEFSNAAPELSSIEFWNSYLKLNNK